jgi:hypothetical protein
VPRTLEPFFYLPFTRGLRRRAVAGALALTLAALSPGGAALAQSGQGGNDAVIVDVVGSGPGLSAADIRSVIADRLGASVVAPGDPAGKGVRRTIIVTLRPDEKQVVIATRDASGVESSQVVLLSDDAAATADAIAKAAAALEQAKKPAQPDEPSAADAGSAAAAGAPGSADELPPKDAPEPGEPKGPSGYFPFNLSFIYPMAINVGRPYMRTNVDVSLMVSYVGAVYGVQTGVVTYSVFDLEGVQASVGALVGGRVTGAQIGATFAYAGGGLTGLQVSGVFGMSSQELWGVQFSGIANQSYEHVYGLQLAGGVNIARRRVRGAQIAGAVNIGKVDGFQFGLINVSANVDGLQLGLINIARRVDGLQVGVINITEDLSGESLGLANILKPGGIHIALWGSNSLYGNAGFKFSSKYAYSIVSAALHKDDGEENVAAGAGLTLGVHLPLTLYVPGLTLSADFGAYRLFRGAFSFEGNDEVLKTRVLVSYELVRRLTLFIGGGAYLGLRGKDDVETRIGPEISGGVEL